MTIEQLKQALEAATPGKWEQNGIAIGIGCHQEICLMAWPSNHPGDISEPFKNSKANAHLIVAAVNNLPKLLKVAEAAKDLPYLYDQASADPYNVGYSQVSDEIELLRKALEELNND